MLSKVNRISSRRLITKLTSQGEAYKTRSFVFKFFPSQFPDSKFSISISKKISAKAVRRNRLKRQISEILRHSVSTLKKPIVCLVIQKKGTREKMKHQEIESEVPPFINHLNRHV